MPPSAEAGAAPAALAPAVDRAIRAVVLLVVCGAAAYLAWASYLGWSGLVRAAAALGAAALAVGLLLATLNYLLRFARWHDLLGRLGHPLPPRRNLPIYVGGLALTATPGKAGETIRSALLLRWGVPVGTSLAAFVVDRATDVIGVLLLAALSGDGAAWWAAALAAGALAGAAAWTARRQHALAQVDRALTHLRLARLARWIGEAAAGYARAWRWRRVALYVGLAMLAYGVQAVVFASYAARLWPPADWRDCIHVFLTSTLAGAASLLPGGLGAMEVALVAQMHARGMPLAEATIAALAVRAVTLWFAIFLGLVCLLWTRREVADRPSS